MELLLEVPLHPARLMTAVIAQTAETSKKRIVKSLLPSSLGSSAKAARFHPENIQLVRASRGLLVLTLSCVALVACAGGGSPGSVTGVLPFHRNPTSASPIKHVIIVIQENRSFDNLFATFPGANGTTTGNLEAVPPSLQGQCPYPYATSIPLKDSTLYVGNDYEHRYETGNPSRPGGFLVDLDGGRMDGFDLSYIPASSKIDCTGPYQYVDPSEIPEYWTLASDYVLADNTFQTQGSGTFTAHQDLIAAGTVVNYPVLSSSSQNSVIDNPTYWYPWGCDANGAKAVTSLITTDLQYLFDSGPFPCYQYATMRDLLDNDGVSWKYYTEQVYGWQDKKHKNGNTPGIWNAFDAIQAVRYGKEWGKRVVWPDTKLFTDIHNGRLPAVSWITPDAPNSDHPQEKCKCDNGPSWVAQIVNAVGRSKYWNSSAMIVLWDDWGGFYDHVPPPFIDNQGGAGFRVPMLIVSPYVQRHVEHTEYEFGSILHFVEDNWNLGNLGRTDVTTKSIGNAFDFNMAPRAFKPIRAKRSLQFFLNQKPSHESTDTE